MHSNVNVHLSASALLIFWLAEMRMECAVYMPFPVYCFQDTVKFGIHFSAKLLCKYDFTQEILKTDTNFIFSSINMKLNQLTNFPPLFLESAGLGLLPNN